MMPKTIFQRCRFVFMVVIYLSVVGSFPSPFDDRGTVDTGISYDIAAKGDNRRVIDELISLLNKVLESKSRRVAGQSFRQNTDEFPLHPKRALPAWNEFCRHFRLKNCYSSNYQK